MSFTLFYSHCTFISTVPYIVAVMGLFSLSGPQCHVCGGDETAQHCETVRKKSLTWLSETKATCLSCFSPDHIVGLKNCATLMDTDVRLVVGICIWELLSAAEMIIDVNPLEKHPFFY